METKRKTMSKIIADTLEEELEKQIKLALLKHGHAFAQKDHFYQFLAMNVHCKIYEGKTVNAKQVDYFLNENIFLVGYYESIKHKQTNESFNVTITRNFYTEQF